MRKNLHETQSTCKEYIRPKISLATISTLLIGLQGCGIHVRHWSSKDSKDSSLIAYTSSNEKKRSNDGISSLKDDSSHYLREVSNWKKDHHFGLMHIDRANQCSQYAARSLRDCTGVPPSNQEEATVKPNTPDVAVQERERLHDDETSDLCWDTFGFDTDQDSDKSSNTSDTVKPNTPDVAVQERERLHDDETSGLFWDTFGFDTDQDSDKSNNTSNMESNALHIGHSMVDQDLPKGAHLYDSGISIDYEKDDHDDADQNHDLLEDCKNLSKSCNKNAEDYYHIYFVASTMY